MFNEIKKILQKSQGTCIIIEDGRPVFVVAKFEDYQKLLENQASLQTMASVGQVLAESEVLEKINQEITNWKTKQAEENPELAFSEGPEEEEVKIEDLPLI